MIPRNQISKQRAGTYVCYALVIALAFGLLTVFEQLSNETVKVLLDFYKTAVEIFFSNSHWFDEGYGRYVGGGDYGGYYIGRECLGLNVTALIFLLCGLLSVRHNSGYVKRAVWVALSGAIAAVVGVVTNILRLLSSIYFLTFADFALIHTLLGVVIYLSAVVLCVYFFDRGRPGVEATQEAGGGEV